MKSSHYPIWTALTLGVACHSQAQTVQPAPKAPPKEVALVDFDSTLLFGAVRDKDVQKFAKGNRINAGKYRLDVYSNNRWLGKHDIQVLESDSDVAAITCFSDALRQQIPIDYDRVAQDLPTTNASATASSNVPASSPVSAEAAAASKASAAPAVPGDCVVLAQQVPGASAQLRYDELRLDIEVPQKYLSRTPRGYVSPSEWSDGVTAATLNYNLNQFRMKSAQNTVDTTYVGLNGGLNLGRFRFRHNGTLAATNGHFRSYQTITNYVRTDITPLSSALTVGDIFTDGQLFNSIGVRGVSLATDERMLPSSRRGYAPTVRGVANGNAKVTVTQNGMVLYETTVAPGPFEINDLYPTGYGGDLLVTVLENSGAQYTYTVPYTAAPQLLRAGAIRYHVTTGEVKESSHLSHYKLTVGTVQYGLNDALTLSGGLIESESYSGSTLGVAFSTPIGAFSAAVLGSEFTTLAQQRLVGHSSKLGWSALLPATQTNIAVATYLQNSENYYGLREAISLLQPGGLFVSNYNQATKERLDVTLSQTMGNKGSLYLYASSSNSWKGLPKTTQYQVGWHKSFGRYMVSASAMRTDTGYAVTHRYALNLNIPLGSGNGVPSLQVATNSGGPQGTSVQSSLYGLVGDQQQWGYGLSASNDHKGTTTGLNASYNGSKASVRGSVSQGPGYTQSAIGASGGLVLHAGGLTAARTLGDTIAIVQAQGAQGAQLRNQLGVHIDSNDFAVVPYLEPYALNSVEIDPVNLSFDTALKSTSQRVVPRAGSVSLVKFETEKSYFLLLSLDAQSVQDLSFGAMVTNERGDVVGSVGQGGKVEAHVSDPSGQLYVDIDGQQGEHCEITYQIPRSGVQTAIQHIQGQCRKVQRPGKSGPRPVIGQAPSPAQPVGGLQLSAHRP